jgi:hypothetical protein
VRTRLWLLLSLSAALLAVPPTAGSHLPHGPKGTLKTAERNLAHAKGACAAYRKVKQARSPRSHCAAIPWLRQVQAERFVAANPAWAWYRSSATQCVVNHEGSATSIGYVNGVPTYYGRFQMDVSFQNETAYGRAAFRRYGTANNWPLLVQVKHAYSIWLYAGWSRWPTYGRYCS